MAAMTAMATAWLTTVTTATAWFTAVATTTTTWLAAMTATVMTAIVTAAVTAVVTAAIVTTVTAVVTAVAAVVTTITATFLSGIGLFADSMLRCYGLYGIHSTSTCYHWLGDCLSGALPSCTTFALAVALPLFVGALNRLGLLLCIIVDLTLTPVWLILALALLSWPLAFLVFLT